MTPLESIFNSCLLKMKYKNICCITIDLRLYTWWAAKNLLYGMRLPTTKETIYNL